MTIEPLERYNDPEETFRMAFASLMTGMWSAMPAIVESYNAVAGTISCQPTINGKQTLPNGTVQDFKMPLLVDVPVCFPRGGGCVLTMPIAQGDEVLVVFADRCIDGWWQLGGVQTQTDMRLHDLSDGFAIPGPWSQPRALANVSTTTAQLRSLDGTTYYEVVPSSKTINIVAPGGINLIGPVATTGTLKNNGVDVGSGHEHGYNPGSGAQTNTTPPTE